MSTTTASAAWTAIWTRFTSRFECWWNGHLLMLHFEPERLCLKCIVCGKETKGWQVGRVCHVDQRAIQYPVELEALAEFTGREIRH